MRRPKTDRCFKLVADLAAPHCERNVQILVFVLCAIQRYTQALRHWEAMRQNRVTVLKNMAYNGVRRDQPKTGWPDALWHWDAVKPYMHKLVLTICINSCFSIACKKATITLPIRLRLQRADPVERIS